MSIKRLKNTICKCHVRAIVQMWKIKGGTGWMVHPQDYVKTLKPFKFCGLCGRRLKK